jgi:hypothetical protein
LVFLIWVSLPALSVCRGIFLQVDSRMDEEAPAMTSEKDRRFRAVVIVTCLLSSPLLSSCQPCGPIWGAGYSDCAAGCSDCKGCADKAKVCAKPTIQVLAHDLDELEEHIEKYGSVVAKQPDVWGQARLTKHREEFEKEMAKELDKFGFTLQGSVSMSDQAYFADAFALSAAASRPSRRAVSSNSTVSSAAAPTAQAALQPSGPQPLPLPDQSDTFAAFSNMSRTPVRTGPTLEFAGTKAGITVEPTVLLDQKARYLNHLQELRRINDGDDTADSPGYALNLLRIPVSVLPGKCTDVGHGAEVTLTLTPYLSEELLPTTFRNLILNDLVDQIGLPVTELINNPTYRVYFDDRSIADVDELITFIETYTIDEILNENEISAKLEKLRWNLGLRKIFTRVEWDWVDLALSAVEMNKERIRDDKQVGKQLQNVVEKRVNTSPFPLSIDYYSPKISGESHPEATVKMSNDIARRSLESAARSAFRHSVVPVPATKTRQARLPFPPSQMVDIYGYDFLFHIAVDAFRVFGKTRFSRPCTDSEQIYIHLPDVQSYLGEELAAAHKFLSNSDNLDLWQFCTCELAAAIRTHQRDRIAAFRQQFKNAVQMKTASESVSHSTLAALAWATIVESALLTDQLVQDMREAAVSKGCPCAPAEWMPYFLPHPPPEARQAFNDYVRCRWPIHVFALDPAVDEQNLADTFSGRREMQLSMSLAFVSGQLSARNMMRYARRIEFDFATIDLNGTAVGFSHGDETFGWRFYPRFQTPDIESNFTVFFRDLLYGGPNRNALLRQRRLEPGIRECVAIVIMPSFVPYATLNVSSNWFKLTNPKCKQLDASYAMKLSKAVKSIENCAPHVGDADCYRDGDLARLLQKAKQLETRLPLQSTRVPIPYENTLGGFAMFNTGVTDLAPELEGWYGSPSINPKEPTTLFLVGNHFSVHHTRVLAGGQYVSNTELLSRQVMKAVIPANPVLMGDADQKFVDIHLATPYGVTQHLPVPVCNAAESDEAKGLAWKQTTISIAYVYGGVGITPPSGTEPKINHSRLVLHPGDVDTNKYDSVEVTLKSDSSLGGGSVVITGKLNKDKKEFEIVGDSVVTQLFAEFGTKFGPEATNPPRAIVVQAAQLKFKSSTDGALPPLEKKAANALTIQWIKASTSSGRGG